MKFSKKFGRKFSNKFGRGFAGSDGSPFQNYYQWITFKPSDIIQEQDGTWAYKDNGLGGNNLKVGNTQVATFDGTVYLQGEVGIFNDRYLTNKSGTSIPTIDYDTDRIYITSGYLEWIDITDIDGNTERIYFQEGNGDKVYSTLGNKYTLPAILHDGNTVAWYKFDDLDTITKDSNNILSRFNDKLSSGHDLIQDVANKQPIWSTEGIYFPRPRAGMTSDTFAYIQPEKIYMLAKFIEVVPGMRLVDTIYGSGRIQCYDETNVLLATTTGGVGPELPVSIGEWHILQVTLNGVNSKMKIDENSVIGGIYPGNMNGITIGSNPSDAQNIHCIIKEIIFRKVDDTEQSEIDIYNYLNNRRNEVYPKIVTIGDSVTGGVTWQPTLSLGINIAWSELETDTGIGTTPMMAVGGSTVVPLIDPAITGRDVGQSIYYRCGFAYIYKPTVIYFFGGFNDVGSTMDRIGNETDLPYTGQEVTENPPTFYSAYKGCLEKLIAQNPNARIIVLAPYYFPGKNLSDIQSIVTAILNCANEYELESHDLLTNLGINASNYATYLNDTVHLNAAGGVLLGNYLIDNF